MNLLLVDDELFALQGICDAVNWPGIGIDGLYTAGSAKTAMEQLESHNIDILLCDIEMPGESGIELVNHVKERYGGTVLCIFLTAHSDFHFAQQAVRLGCFDYILKPAKPRAIEEVLLRAVKQIGSNQKKRQYQDYGERYFKEMIGKLEKEQDEKSVDGIVDACVAYIQAHIQDTLSVKELADMNFVSADYLTRLFKKRFGKGVLSYIRDQRMFLAKELLEKTDLSVTTISAKSGYENYAAFTTSFKKYYGMPPREYREKLVGKKKVSVRI